MSTVKANDLQSATGTIPTVIGQQLIPTAWVHFNGTGTIAIVDSENVSSITDIGTGKYTINFSTTMANANYCVTTSIERWVSWLDGGTNVTATNTSDFRVENTENNAKADTGRFYVVVMGGQA